MPVWRTCTWVDAEGLDLRSGDNNAFWLEAVGLCCSRGGRVLFDDFGFRLEAGRLLQIEGVNGSGKTTLLKVLNGLMEPGAGVVRWSGTPINEDMPAYHSVLRYVGHTLGYKLELSAIENLSFASTIAGSKDLLTPHQALAYMGLTDYTDRLAKFLSAGQKRRLALARLLTGRAPLWLLDEPSVALDDGGRRIVEKMLAEHLERGGMAVITTHQHLDVTPSHTLRLQSGARTV